MARLLSMPVTIFVMAVLQVCSALKPQTGSKLYRIMSRGLYLQPHEIDRPVHFVPDIQHEYSSVWEVSQVDENRVTIRHPQLDGYLAYIEAYPGALLMLQSEPRYWMLNKVDDDGRFEILASTQYEGKPLVVDEYPLDVWPPLAGLGFRRKNNGHVLEFEHVVAEEHDALLSFNVINDGTYLFRSKGLYLTATDQPGGSLQLSYYPSQDAQWTITSFNGCKQNGAVIRSDSTGLYLGFDYMVPGANLRMQREPRLWTLEEVRRTVFALRTTKDYQGKPLAAAFFSRAGRPTTGLALPGQGLEQDWEILAW